jgi:hypothetical protein
MYSSMAGKFSEFVLDGGVAYFKDGIDGDERSGHP